MTALEDDVIVVTGASRGLGRAMAERFVEDGARVVLTARDSERLETVAAELPGDSLVVPADVRDSDDVERVIDRTLERFGRLDTLVNNAGVSLLHKDDHDELGDITEDEWDRVLEVNLKGVFLFTRAAVPQLYEQGHGTIINISSGLGRRAIPGAAAYVSSKWGLEGLTRATALESEPYGVTVNGLDPGGRVNTDIWAHLPAAEREEILQPDVMNDAAVLLAAQGPDGVTGESMTAQEWEQRLG
ncbi:SDR family NAD(P)-dependent oxidoreductase [Natronorubrum sulfidifaciens]|uniref:Short-chain dehydrogenase/reductase SDR n=1 Tax=Natronorubrum sulfidifaciens JCM 14089 TaxID=1230460 RepID=L9WEG5_9EURY|nr:SDR family oxidoreductase [Natronorubrum sulfidifaciens]ELY47656.1 short-chain dehydrogenase/reductase SDR [Natronorubrum sulfidifaciens JCM 14089]